MSPVVDQGLSWFGPTRLCWCYEQRACEVPSFCSWLFQSDSWVFAPVVSCHPKFAPTAHASSYFWSLQYLCILLLKKTFSLCKHCSKWSQVPACPRAKIQTTKHSFMHYSISCSCTKSLLLILQYFTLSVVWMWALNDPFLIKQASDSLILELIVAFYDAFYLEADCFPLASIQMP